MTEEYRDEIRINKFELADLLEHHQDLYLKWGEAHADAIHERDKLKSKFDLEKADAKDELEYVRAGLELDILTNYEKHGFKKAPSDKVREVWVIRQDKYQDALGKYRDVVSDFNDKLIDAEHEINVLKTVKEAFEHRKADLDNLCRLMVGGFYSAKLPTGLEGEVKEKRDRELAERSRERTNANARRRLKGEE